MGKPRSPHYPAIGLSEAIKAVQAVYEKDHRNKMDMETVAKHTGSTSLNGRALSRISALRKYGLIDGPGKDLQVTQDAVIIIADPVESLERRAAINRAARRPTLFGKLFKRYAGQTPSEEAMRSYLMKEGFTSKGVSKAAKAFLDTMALVTNEGKEYHPDDEDGEMGKDDFPWPPPGPPPRPTIKGVTLMGNERVWSDGILSKEATYRVIVSGKIGPKEIDRLILKLRLDREILADLEDDAADALRREQEKSDALNESLVEQED